MIGDTHHNEARFIDRGDWPQALACLIFLIVFPLEHRAFNPQRILLL
jgi:hypothetical protein